MRHHGLYFFAILAFSTANALATPELELGPAAGLGARHTRGHFDTELLDGYSFNFAAELALEARLGFDPHGLSLRGFAQRDLVVDEIQPEHMNAFGADLAYFYRAPFGRSSMTAVSLSGGWSVTRFDAVWDDGLRGLGCLFSSECFDQLRALRQTDQSFDHTATGPLIQVGLEARTGRFVFGAGVTHRLLFSVDNDTSFVHHVALFGLRGAYRFGEAR